MTKKQSTATRSRAGRPAASPATKRRKGRSPAPRRSRFDASTTTPTPLVCIISVSPASPVVPCTLTVTASCRTANGETCNAYLLDTSSNPTDVAPATGPGPDPNNAVFTFNLTVPGKTYAVEVYIEDEFGDVLVSDSRTVTTS